MITLRGPVVVRWSPIRWAAFVAALASASVASQSDQTAPSPTFDVASIKRTDLSGAVRQIIADVQPGGVWRSTFATPYALIDRTGLTQTFDIELQYSDAAPRVNEENGPPLRAALAEQLGLKLDESRMRVEVLVIDRIERPPQTDGPIRWTMPRRAND